MSLLRTFARPLIASSFVLAGLERVRNSEQDVQALEAPLTPVTQALPVEPLQVTRALGWSQVGAGAFFALGLMPRLAATVLTVTAAFGTLAEYKSAPAQDAQKRQDRRRHLAKNVSLTGAALLAAADTAGKPSWAWRAGHLAEAGRKKGRKRFAQAQKSAVRAAKKAASDAVDLAGA